MVPKLGSFCDLCPLPVHYLLTCASCSHPWEEPSFPGEVTCPRCGTTLVVSHDDHVEFKRLALSQRRSPVGLARCGGEFWAPGTPPRRSEKRSG